MQFMIDYRDDGDRTTNRLTEQLGLNGCLDPLEITSIVNKVHL